MEIHNNPSTLLPPLAITNSYIQSIFFDTLSDSIPEIIHRLYLFSHPANLSLFTRFSTHSHNFSAKSRVSCKVCIVQS